MRRRTKPFQPTGVVGSIEYHGSAFFSNARSSQPCRSPSTGLRRSERSTVRAARRRSQKCR